jgi:pyridinium-3,5-biscarboxylic acid mononucleotide sulfurtransferase
MDDDLLEEKYRQLCANLKDMGRVVVAFSGGVDSTLLLKVAKDVMGDGVLAVTAISETTPRHEWRDAVQLAAVIGVPHELVETHELTIPEFAANPADKCYICKKHRFGGLIQLARAKGYLVVVDGGNRDDHKDYRPGLRACEELGVRSPLAEAGLTKAEIRLLSKKLQLPTWDKPSYACLASRIPYHRRITAEKLRQVDQAEEFLRGLGLCRQVRVRHHGEIARIEVGPEDMAKFLQEPVRRQVVARLKEIGFQFVALDMEGYSMGSLNRTIDQQMARPEPDKSFNTKARKDAVKPKTTQR